MLFDTSYTNKETIRKINHAVGTPFSWKKRIKMGGIGSRRMVIHEISKEYERYLNAHHYESKANLELRPKGVIIHFRHRLQCYSWVMPFDKMTLHHGTFLKLTCEEKFIQFNEPKNERFIQKMIEMKDK